ncbi:MAG: 6-carboxytetrahydropterin synthase [Gammaproteobacteria bacterium]|nr:6-carboxytetrahydropterin synthase [Gammaproteobacteria bacterium]MCH9717179.1 6-carboxytetrahydropterin synthase [Gammaproteobacteria bacterium]MCH9763091.1 6-carboxytetrahydropterin synthase [Gammaproteobacteria bacterium]
MSTYLTTVELHKPAMSFSAGHTTIFSATDREPLHGHRYEVYLGLSTQIEENGLTFDYRYYKDRVQTLCKQLHQTFLMPTESPYLIYDEDETYHYFTFNHKKMVFLKEDITLMPLANITIEELSRWFVQELIHDELALERHHIARLVIKIFSAPGQSASHTWER